MTFHVGQKVVCIKEWPNWIGRVALPKKDCIYTVREMLDDGREPSMRLVEIVNPVSDCWSNVTPREIAFVLYAFRPLIERKAEISFTANAPKDSEKWDNRKRVKVRA